MAALSGETSIDVVIPTRGRATLQRLLEALGDERERIGEVHVVRDDGSGPAAARNRGWRASRAEWIAFLDDDVVPGREWGRRLAADLEGLGPSVAGSQARLRVPAAPGRRPTDWERSVAGLEGALWITADLAYRRRALESVGGFDERFSGPYREDTDLAMRLLRDGWQIVGGRRLVEHPVAPAPFWASVAKQRGNADDVLMRALHGRHWRRWGRAPAGRLRRHLLAAAALGGAGASLAADRRAPARALAAAWLGLSAELALARIAPGPRDREEVSRMLATSAVLPLAAASWWAWGWLRLPLALARGGPRGSGAPPERPAPRAVLLDRDGTLLFDVPYNGDPEKVAPMPGARRALERLRAAGVPLAVVSNQSGVRRGLIDGEQVRAVNRRAEEVLGPVGPWLVCPHAPEDGCSCRKPEPGLVLDAAHRLGVEPDSCAVIGDVAADVQAAQAAGAAAVLVPTERTQEEDVRMAPLKAPTIEAAVEQLLGGPR